MSGKIHLESTPGFARCLETGFYVRNASPSTVRADTFRRLSQDAQCKRCAQILKKLDQAPAPIAAYARQCVEHRVTVRGYDCIRTDHPDGRRTYLWQRDACENFRELSTRQAKLKADIDEAVDALVDQVKAKTHLRLV